MFQNLDKRRTSIRLMKIILRSTMKVEQGLNELNQMKLQKLRLGIEGRTLTFSMI
jgi:hypothetical protein